MKSWLNSPGLEPSLSLSTRILNLFVSAIIYRWKDTRRDAEEFSIAGATDGDGRGWFWGRPRIQQNPNYLVKNGGFNGKTIEKP